MCNHHFPFSPLQFTRSVQCCIVAAATGISYREHYATCHSSRREPSAAASASEWVGVLLPSERASEHDSPLPTALNLAFVIVCGCKPSSHRTTRRSSPNPLPPPSAASTNSPVVVLRAGPNAARVPFGVQSQLECQAGVMCAHLGLCGCVWKACASERYIF